MYHSLKYLFFYGNVKNYMYFFSATARIACNCDPDVFHPVNLFAVDKCPTLT